MRVFSKLRHSYSLAKAIYQGKPVIANIECKALSLKRFEGTVHLGGTITVGKRNSPYVYLVTRKSKRDV